MDCSIAKAVTVKERDKAKIKIKKKDLTHIIIVADQSCYYKFKIK
jgi:hypothetical protein